MFANEKKKKYILDFYITKYKYLLYVIRFVLKYHDKLKKIIDILLITIVMVNIARVSM